jgi:hypothetical protein
MVELLICPVQSQCPIRAHKRKGPLRVEALRKR